MPQDEPSEERLKRIEDGSFKERLKDVSQEDQSIFPIEDNICDLVFYVEGKARAWKPLPII